MIGYEGAARYARLIQALTGDDQIVPPGILLEMDRPEYSALKNEQLLYNAQELVVATSTNFAHVGVHQPQANKVTVIWPVIWNLHTSTQNFKIGFVSPMTQDSTSTGGARDTRLGSQSTQFYKRENATVNAQLGNARFALTTAAFWAPRQPWVIVGPSLDLVIANIIAQASGTANVHFFGYERSLRPEEISQG